MITDKRKTEIIDNFLSWMIEHHNNDEDLYFTLKNVIGMTKEELHEFDIESLDEYYEKAQEKAEEETLDTITAEDLVEQAVYLANAPDGVTAEDKSEAMLGMLGANIVDESVYEEPDYKKEVIESVKKEYAEYEKELLKGDAEEVYCHSYETTVKTEIHDGICGEVPLGDKVYEALYQKRGEILKDMHSSFIGDLSANLFTKEGVKKFIERYCKEEYPEIMSESSPRMGMG